ncbi:MAG: hypothetical protein ACLQM8_19380 [Limisphaerales bacterium]
MKGKIGTQLEEGVYRQLKMLAAQERHTISDLVRTAVSGYLIRKKHKSGHRHGLKRLLARPAFKLTDEQFRESMEADFYDQ